MPQPDSPHALIIEDEMITSLDMQAILGELGFRSFAFASTQDQGLEQARLRRPDLITADVNLMHGGGVAAVRAIIAALGPIPAVYVTGEPEALEDQADAVVVRKPFGRAEIAQAYDRVTRQASAA